MQKELGKTLLNSVHFSILSMSNSIKYGGRMYHSRAMWSSGCPIKENIYREDSEAVCVSGKMSRNKWSVSNGIEIC